MQQCNNQISVQMHTTKLIDNEIFDTDNAYDTQQL